MYCYVIDINVMCIRRKKYLLFVYPKKQYQIMSSKQQRVIMNTYNTFAYKSVFLIVSVLSQADISTTSSRHHQDEESISLDQLLQDNSKKGVFDADFENKNNTIVTVRDGDSVVLNCRVYLLHDKTVSWSMKS